MKVDSASASFGEIIVPLLQKNKQKIITKKIFLHVKHSLSSFCTYSKDAIPFFF